MQPDIQQHIAVMSAILLAIGEILRRLKKRNLGRLRLTIESIPDNSSDLSPNTKQSEEDGAKVDTKP